MRISANGSVTIACDTVAIAEITAYIGQDQRHKDKFIDIIAVLLGELTNRHLYKREKISAEIKNVTAMRFFVGQENDRIYCQEMSAGEKKKIVILGILHLHKDTDELSAQELKEIETLSKYEYEIEPRK
jgi:ABC-type cobalamin/Fe3+-siderophores transport system ATPase subunit